MAATETMMVHKAKNFTTWTFTENVCQLPVYVSPEQWPLNLCSSISAAMTILSRQIFTYLHNMKKTLCRIPICPLIIYTLADAYPLEGQIGMKDSNTYKAVLGLELRPLSLNPQKTRYLEALIPSISACGLIWRSGLYRGIHIKMRL